MRNKTLAGIAFSVALAAAPLLAQQANAPVAGSSTGGQSSQEQSGSMTDASIPIHLIGTVSSVGDTRLEVKVESGTAAGSTAMVGTTQTFALDKSTEKPEGLKVGDRVDLWFRNDQPDHLATRIALADSGAGSTGSAESTGAAPAAGSDNQAQAQPAGAAGGQTDATAAATASTGDAQATAQAKPERRGKLPQSGSDLPLVGLVGVAALAAAFGLRFAVRS